MDKKYELTDETKEYYGNTLHRIRALRDFGYVKKDDLGGWIEKEDNLSHEGDCWIYDDAIIYGNALVYGDARIYGNAEVYDYAIIYGNARIYNNAEVYNYAEVYGNAMVCNNARVCCNKVTGNAEIRTNAYIATTNDYITIGPIGSRDDYTTFYLDKDNNIWVSCGCFNDTIDKFKEEVLEVHNKDNKYGKDYLAAIEFVKIKLI